MIHISTRTYTTPSYSLRKYISYKYKVLLVKVKGLIFSEIHIHFTLYFFPLKKKRKIDSLVYFIVTADGTEDV